LAFRWRDARGKEAIGVKPKWKWLPTWDMPSDPVKAVSWFLRWFLQVLVRYFSVVIVAGVVYETYLNGIVGLFGTLLVGLIVWAVLAGVLAVVNFMSSVTKAISGVSHLSQNPFGSFGSFEASNSLFATHERDEENVVEGSIITDLEEERRKRRQEM
jgi:hypothetical protein